jgi:2-haloacid dehalogenase/putative hydrolase of the HAD superfamily
MAAPEILTFDCYGTLIDWERGIVEAFAEAARRNGITLQPEEVITAYHAVEPEVESASYRPYREVLAESAVRVAGRLGWTLDESAAAFLPESLPSWPPFPDTGPALERLARAGIRLGILSNVDDDLLSGTRRLLPDVFDPSLVVTAQQVRSYKPAPGHFLEARRRIGDRPWLHAAQSHFHDVTPTFSMGIPNAWVNRKREPLPDGGPSPTLEVATLAELADRLLG